MLSLLGMFYAFYDHDTVLLNAAFTMCQVERLGTEGKPNPLGPCGRFWRALCTHHGQLGLKLNFQGLQGPFQLCDLILGGGGCPGIGGDLCLQGCTLNKNEMQSQWADGMSGHGFCVATALAAQR